MKTTKLFLTGLLLFVATTFVSYGDDASDLAALVSSLSTSSSSTSTTATSLLGNICQYMDATLLKNFAAAYAADQASASPSTPEGFLLNYMTDHPDFAKTVTDAIDQAKKAQGITTDDALSNKLVDQLKDLKKQIDDNKNLTDDQKSQYNDLLQKYNAMAQNMQNQIASSNASLNKALDSLTKPQEKDPTMMIMMILMMVMQMMKGGCGGK